MEAKTVEDWLDKACRYENQFVAGDESAKRKANMAFRRAMTIDDGRVHTGDVIT